MCAAHRLSWHSISCWMFWFNAPHLMWWTLTKNDRNLNEKTNNWDVLKLEGGTRLEHIRWKKLSLIQSRVDMTLFTVLHFFCLAKAHFSLHRSLWWNFEGKMKKFRCKRDMVDYQVRTGSFTITQKKFQQNVQIFWRFKIFKCTLSMCVRACNPFMHTFLHAMNFFAWLQDWKTRRISTHCVQEKRLLFGLLFRKKNSITLRWPVLLFTICSGIFISCKAINN